MEGWKIGSMEDWKIGRVEDWLHLPCLKQIADFRLRSLRQKEWQMQISRRPSFQSSNLPPSILPSFQAHRGIENAEISVSVPVNINGDFD